MNEIDNVWNNAFAEPKLPDCKQRASSDVSPKRYRLLDYDDVMKLSDVMETTVPIDGKGNFPSLQVTPSTLVQMVSSSLAKEGIRVSNVRLNGSAATHVLSDDGKHPYKDLDLIFAIDLSEYNDCYPCVCHPSEYNENSNNSNSYCRTKGYKHAGRKTISCRTNWLLKPPECDANVGKISAHDMRVDGADETDDKNADRVPSSVSIKDIAVEDEEVDLEDKESGYTSSGSSVSSLPISPSGSWVHQNPVRSRTHSLDSSSSVASSSSVQYGVRYKDGQHGPKKTEQYDFCVRSKDSCWQKIKSVVMTILRELLPAGVKSSRMTDAIVTDAYVQKMVKITNDADRWSLISLNNNEGRNLELKFVEKMRRQYEFSVDSFQIILDSYQRFKVAARGLEKDSVIDLSSNFFPSVVAESVYGDIQAALRHLRHRRICTKRPEEIRGGGLLRYCNLRVRDFTPGEVEGYESDGDHETMDDQVTSAGDVQSYSTSKPEAVKKLEQLMCSRFFIDFSEFDRQQRKLQSYLNGHFQKEEDLKFQYLLVVGNVVERGNVCLMSNERTKILNYIRRLAVDVLSMNVSSSPKLDGFTPSAPSLTPHIDPSSSAPQYYPQIQYRHSTYPQQRPQPDYSQAYPPYPISNEYSHGCYYLPQQPYYPEPAYYPHCDAEGYYNRIAQVPIAVCPSCQSTYATQAVNCPPPAECRPVNSGTPTPRHTMSPDSVPFMPSSKSIVPDLASTPMKVIYLGENDKLIYSARPVETNDAVDTKNPPTDPQS